jgi:hypothetical protein
LQFDDLEKLMHPQTLVDKIIEISKGQLQVINGTLHCRSVAIPTTHAIFNWIQRYIEAGMPYDSLVAFLIRLVKNPSYRVRQDLLTFLEYGKLPITSDGYFLAYKKVSGTYKDIHSGTVDYSVGRKVAMPRCNVDDNPNNTCSAGLHVCSFDYLSHFGSTVNPTNRVVVCKIDPANVISIPTDYHNTKMRVCMLEVVQELENHPTQSNVWDREMVDDYDFDDCGTDDSDIDDSDTDESDSQC